jgi:hypothetical protein
MKQYTQAKPRCKVLNVVFNRFNVFNKSLKSRGFNEFHGVNKLNNLWDFDGFYVFNGFNIFNKIGKFNEF